ncbi:MAG TPA: hypothetical protein VLJ11_06450 [Bryobacteraceae bacterium]|nr:hypothetical protein [Bryobacteraceae bacterium]
MEKLQSDFGAHVSGGAALLCSPTDPTDAPGESVSHVLGSRTFQNTPALRSLLIYLWKNRDAQISEYAIGTEALGRSSHFDPKTDATVRVQISRLRQRLEKFYEEEGQTSRERLSIPLGSHQVQVETARTSAAALAAAPVATASGPPLREPKSRRLIVCLVAAVVLLLVFCAYQAILLRKAHTAGKQAKPEDGAWLWKAFFSNGRQTRIILPTPAFFSFRPPGRSPNSSIMFRDTEVNSFADRDASPLYRTLERELGHSSLADNYTVTSDTFACIRLARYLDGFGWQTAVTSSADAPLEALDKENMIAVGTWGTLTPLRPYLDRMSFELGAHETYVKLRNPAPNEPKRIESIVESPERTVWPGVIALLPGHSGHTRLLILASRHTSALVSFLTSSNGLDQLERLWKAKGSPAYFEVVVNAELSGRGLVRFWPVVLHPYKNKT